MKTNFVNGKRFFSWFQPVTLQSCCDQIQQTGSVLGLTFFTIQPPANIELKTRRVNSIFNDEPSNSRWFKVKNQCRLSWKNEKNFFLKMKIRIRFSVRTIQLSKWIRYLMSNRATVDSWKVKINDFRSSWKKMKIGLWFQFSVRTIQPPTSIHFKLQTRFANCLLQNSIQFTDSNDASF